MKVVLILLIVIVVSLAHPYMLDTNEESEDLALRELGAEAEGADEYDDLVKRKDKKKKDKKKKDRKGKKDKKDKKKKDKKGKKKEEDDEEDQVPQECSGDRCDLTNGGKLYLKTGQEIGSSKIRVIMQSDGNLVVYCKSCCPCRRRAVWASNTYKAEIDTGMKIEKDGNMVLYKKDGDVAWESDTHEKGAKFSLRAQEDSNLELYKIVGGKETSIWSSNTYGRC